MIFKSDRLSVSVSGQKPIEDLPQRAGVPSDSANLSRLRFAQAMWAPARSAGIVTLKSGA